MVRGKPGWEGLRWVKVVELEELEEEVGSGEYNLQSKDKRWSLIRMRESCLRKP